MKGQKPDLQVLVRPGKATAAEELEDPAAEELRLRAAEVAAAFWEKQRRVQILAEAKLIQGQAKKVIRGASRSCTRGCRGEAEEGASVEVQATRQGPKQALKR